jgi:fatty acid desaturase
LYWVYAGYVAVYYLFLAAAAAWNLPTHPQPLWGAFAYFVLVPSLLVALTIEPTTLVASGQREGVRRLFQNGRMSRARAFRGGALIGVVALGCAIGIFFSWDALMPGALWPMFVVVVPVFLGGVLCPWWIVRLAQKEPALRSEIGRAAP